MGLREWWNRINGDTNKPEETGLSDQSEQPMDDYQEHKADSYTEQRDPGIIGMGSGDDKGGF
jgi:hypothetical protein